MAINSEVMIYTHPIPPPLGSASRDELLGSSLPGQAGFLTIDMAWWTSTWGTRLGWVYAWLCLVVVLAMVGRLLWWSHSRGR